LGAQVDGVTSGPVGADVPRPSGGGCRGEEASQLLWTVSESTGRDDHRTGGDRVVPHGDARHHAVLEQEPVDPLAQGEVDARFPGTTVQDIDDGLTSTNRDVDAGHAFVATDDQ
jgi:hypothetical protein